MIGFGDSAQRLPALDGDGAGFRWPGGEPAGEARPRLGDHPLPIPELPPFMKPGAGPPPTSEQAARRPLNAKTAAARTRPCRQIVDFPMSPLLARPPARKKA